MSEESAARVDEDPITLHPIQAVLNAAYGDRWANRDRQSPEDPIRVDDEQESDVEEMLPRLTVVTTDHEDDEFTVQLGDSVLSVIDERILRQHGCEISQSGRRWCCQMHLRLAQLDTIRSLATAAKAVTARGQQYYDRNLRWIAPRTAKALYRLAGELEELVPDLDHTDDFRRPANW